MLCPSCHENNPEGAEFCLNCGSKLGGKTLKDEFKEAMDAARMESRYSGMKTIAAVYHVCGWIVAILSLIIAFRAYELSGAGGFIVIFIIGAIPANILYSNGDRLKVLVDTEQNTRQTAEYLRLMLNLMNRNGEE